MTVTIRVSEAKKVNGDWGLFLSFPYNMEVVNTIRDLPSRFWDKDTKEWEVPFDKLTYLISKLENHTVNIVAETAKPFEPKKAIPKVDYSFKTKPFAHQIDGFNYGLEHEKWLLGDEQGLGKTKQVIDIAVALKKQYSYPHCLIICGVNGLKWNWQNEIAIHSNETGHILGQYRSGGKLKIGSTKQKLADLESVENIDSYFLITNVESFRDEAIAKKINELCKKKVIGLLAFDECHKAKNPSSQQGKGILKVKADHMIAMSGTPLMNNPLDLYIILKWLGYEKNAFYKFKNHYCVTGGYGGYEVIGYRHLDELQDQLNSIMLRRLKSDVLDLPEKVFIDEYVDMTAKQAQIYKEVTMAVMANIDQIKMATNPLSEMIRMRQATGYTGILSSTIKESAKLDRMMEIIEESVQNGQKVVVFSNWTQMTDKVFEIVQNSGYKPALITGQTNDEDRQTMVKMFQNNPDCKVIIGTIGAMGTGLTLTAGTVEIFLDEPWNMALRDQAVDRCHRIGAKSNVTIYTLLAKDTIDEKIHQLVYKKGAMADALVDGKVQNKEALVEFLLS